MTQNFCSECKWLDSNPSVAYCTTGFKAEVDLGMFFYVHRPAAPVMKPKKECREARAYHAEANLIDPVPCCPRWEAR